LKRRRTTTLTILCALALAAVVPATADAARRLLVVGDSLAEGTRPYIPRELSSWRVQQNVAVSMQHYSAASIVRSYGRALPRVIHVSVGTNGAPGDTGGFRASVRAVMAAAGSRRCVVWANIVRPPYGGVSYAGLNRVLADESRRRKNLRIVNWARMVRQNPGWLAGDGVHVSATGYAVRSRRVATSVRRCD